MTSLNAVGQMAFEWTWKTSLHATLLIVLVIVLQKILAKWLTPRLRYALSLLVLIRLLLPIPPFSVFSFENLYPPAARVAQPAAILPSPKLSLIEVPAVQAPSPIPPNPATVQAPSLSGTGTLGFVWVSGCLCLILLAGFRFWKWNGCVRSGRRISDPQLLEFLNRARTAMKVRSPVELVALTDLSSPAVFGLFRCRLLLPENALRQLKAEELRMIFLHEMAHIRRGDVLLNYLIIAVQFLHWFNPLVWLALHRLRADRELVCDAMVMEKLRPEERLGYGKVLLKLIDGFSASNLVFSGAIPVVSGTTEIKRRVLMIKNHRHASNMVCAMSALLILALGFGSFTRARAQDQPQAAPKATAMAGSGDSHSAEFDRLDLMTEAAIETLKEGLKKVDPTFRRYTRSVLRVRHSH